MADDVREGDEDIKEGYHKVDKRDWLHEDGEGASEQSEAAESPDASEPVEAPGAAEAGAEAVEVDTNGLLRMCLGMFVEQAWVHLGLQAARGATETRVNLAQAKLAIDTVAYMRNALDPDLGADEKREVDQWLANLRLNFVQRS